jgi:hypothetical protein
MSQRPEESPDRFRLGTQHNSTSNARREKQVVRPPLAGRGRGGGTRLHMVDVAGGSTSQTGPSQMVDATQYQDQQNHHEEYHKHYQEEAHQPQYQEGYQPQYHEGYQHPQQQAELGMEDEGFPGGPYELSLLPNFGKHVACKLWNDKIVSIICFI